MKVFLFFLLRLLHLSVKNTSHSCTKCDAVFLTLHIPRVSINGLGIFSSQINRKESYKTDVTRKKLKETSSFVQQLFFYIFSLL